MGRDSEILRLSISVTSERTGGRIAAGLLTLGVLWAALIPLAAWRIASPSTGAGRWAAAMVYAVGARVCHQRPERSFEIAGVPWPVCGRCTGLYLSAGLMALIGLVTGAARLPSPASRAWRVIFVLAALPTAISWAAERLAAGDPGNLARAACAIPLGAAVAAALAAVRREGAHDT